MFGIRKVNHHIHRVLLCIVLLLFMVIPFGGEAESFYRSNKPIQYAVGANYVWVVEGENVSTVQISSGEKQAVGVIKSIVRIASEADNLVYLVNSAGRQTLAMIDNNGHELYCVEIPSEMDVWQIEVNQNTVYVLGEFADEASSEVDMHGHAHANRAVYQITPYIDHSFEKLIIDGWNNEYITSLALSDDYLYTYSSDTLEACAVELKTHTLAQTPVSVTHLSYITPANTVDGIPHLYALCYSDQASLWLVNMQSGEKTKVVAKLPDDCYGLRRSRDTLYTLDAKGTTLLSVPIEMGNKSESITIINSLRENTQRMRKATELFHTRYPDIEIAFQWIDDPRILSTGIMSGAEGYDIICVQEHMSVTSSAMMYKAGAIVKLSDYEDITALLPEFLDMFGPVSMEGNLYGVPEMVLPYFWEVDSAIAEKIGCDIPKSSWTWHDFFALADSVAQYNRQNNEYIVLLYDPNFLPYFLIQYNANTVDVMNGTAAYTDSEFIALLAEWRGVYDMGLIDDSNVIPSNALFKTCATDYYGMQSRVLILPPVFNDETRYPTEYVTMEVSANASNKEAAVYFLACYMTPEVLLSEPIDIQGQWLTDIERYTRFDIEISPENEALWRTILSKGTQDYFIGDLYRDQGNTLYPRLLAGEISAEQFAQVCQRRANMVLRE